MPTLSNRFAFASATRSVARLAAVTLSLSACFFASGGEARVPIHAQLDTSVVRFVGRFDPGNDGRSPKFAWSGSAMQARFTGSSLAVRLHDDGANVFQVVVDGVPTHTLTTSSAQDAYTVANGLADGVHDLALVKRTEARVGTVQLFGFSPAAGHAMLAPPIASTRRLEFIGDSITAGYGDEGNGPYCTFSPGQENEFLGYSALTARALGAEHVTVAWSGKTIDEMRDLWDRTLPKNRESHWDFIGWVPDAVVVNLGTNDFAQGTANRPAFVASYVKMLEKVRSRYPHTQIVAALGPMLSDTYPPGAKALSSARAYTSEAVDALRAKGDAKVSMVEFATQDPTDGYGCHFHPNLATHRKMASRLAPALAATLGW
jgi:lysophospholipase L1-like esterase